MINNEEEKSHEEFAENTTENSDYEQHQQVNTSEQTDTALEEQKEKFLRLFAEFENYKKRTAKERVELFKTAGQEVITALLPILDDFDRAIIEIGKSSDENLLKGVELIQNKFFNTLKSKGLELVSVEKMDSFDSEIHEAITMFPAPSEDLKGKIIEVIEKGYKLGDKIIRYPKVVVAQ